MVGVVKERLAERELQRRPHLGSLDGGPGMSCGHGCVVSGRGYEKSFDTRSDVGCGGGRRWAAETFK